MSSSGFSATSASVVRTSEPTLAAFSRAVRTTPEIRRFTDIARTNAADAIRCLAKKDTASLVRLASTWEVKLTTEEAQGLINSYHQIPRDQLKQLESVFDTQAFT